MTSLRDRAAVGVAAALALLALVRAVTNREPTPEPPDEAIRAPFRAFPRPTPLRGAPASQAAARPICV